MNKEFEEIKKEREKENKEFVDKLNKITDECFRFMCRLDAWKVRLSNDSYALICGSKEGGSCKRASLDLSRELVNLRKGFRKY